MRCHISVRSSAPAHRLKVWRENVAKRLAQIICRGASRAAAL
jgi:hypothetical protein